MGGLTDVTVSLLKSAIGVSAPVLSSLLGTPATGVILSLLAHAFGSDANQPDTILDKINTDTEASIKLKSLELAHSESLSKLANEKLFAQIKDIEDARRYGEVYKTFLIQMAFIVTAGFFGVLFMLFAPISISDEGRNLLSMLVGMLASKWQTIVDFFYGSSHSRKAKIK